MRSCPIAALNFLVNTTIQTKVARSDNKVCKCGVAILSEKRVRTADADSSDVGPFRP